MIDSLFPVAEIMTENGLLVPQKQGKGKMVSFPITTKKVKKGCWSYD